jgi:hypothetical protein
MARMTVSDLVQLRLANDAEEARHPPPPRPKTRADCIDGPRPCPWACRYSLLHEITTAGGVKTVHPKDADGHEHSCVLDYADDHVDGATCEEIAIELNVTRECVRQIEENAIRKLKRYGAALRECL